MAHSASNDPTDRSMPPVKITGVMASASKPISTDSLTTSKAFPVVAKFVPVRAKMRHLMTSTTTSRISNRSRDLGMSLTAQSIRSNGNQDNTPRDRLLPLWRQSQEDESRSDGREQQD